MGNRDQLQWDLPALDSFELTRAIYRIPNSLLHRPAVLFLDEPTIGLDVAMQRRLRTFVAEYNQRHGATVMPAKPLHVRTWRPCADG